MKGELKIFITGIVLVFLGGLLQNTEFITLYGVKMNLVLVLLLTFGFFINNPWHYLILALEGTLLLKVSPGLDTQTLVLLVLIFLAFWLRKYLAWQPIISNVFLIAVATTLFHLLIDFNFLIYNTPTILLEVLYNIIGGLILYLILEKTHELPAQT